MHAMIIDSVQYYKIGYAADITGYTIQELKDMFKDQNIPGKEVAGDLMFSMDDIKTIQKKRRATHTLKQPVQKFSPPLISLTEAAERTGYKPSTLKDYVKSGKVPGNNFSGNISFTEAQIAEIIRIKEQNKKKPVEKIPDEKKTIVPVTSKPVKKRIVPSAHPESIPTGMKREYECAKRIAKSRGEPVTVYLLKAASQDIEKKREAMREILE